MALLYVCFMIFMGPSYQSYTPLNGYCDLFGGATPTYYWWFRNPIRNHLVYIQTFLNNRDVSYQPQHGEWSFPDFWTAIKQVISFVSPWPSRFWRSFDAGGRGVSVFHHCVKFGRLFRQRNFWSFKMCHPLKKRHVLFYPTRKTTGKKP